MAKGDHIKVRRMGVLFAHHGIDLGDGTVVHFGEPKDDPMVRRTGLDQFLGGGKKRVVSYDDGKALPEEKTCELALGQVGSRGYKLAANNCEHFATWCKTGKPKSFQVGRALAGAAAAALIVVVALGRRFRA